MKVLDFKTKNPYTQTAIDCQSAGLIKEMRQLLRFESIWLDGYEAGKTGKKNPWKNAPNRIVWGIGSMAYKCDTDPEYAKVFRNITKGIE